MRKLTNRTVIPLTVPNSSATPTIVHLVPAFAPRRKERRRLRLVPTKNPSDLCQTKESHRSSAVPTRSLHSFIVLPEGLKCRLERATVVSSVVSSIRRPSSALESTPEQARIAPLDSYPTVMQVIDCRTATLAPHSQPITNNHVF